MKAQGHRYRSDSEPEVAKVQADEAYCAPNARPHRLSELENSAGETSLDTKHPPSGAWFRETPDGFRAGASTRSWGAIFVLPFVVCLSVMILCSEPGRQIVSGEFDLNGSFWVISFSAMTAYFWFVALSMCFGKVEVSVEGIRGEVFTGLGNLGGTQTFDTGDVVQVDEECNTAQMPGGLGRVIVLSGKTQIRFGAGLTHERRSFLLNLLRWRLAKLPLRKTGLG